MQNRILALIYRILALAQMVICLYVNMGFYYEGKLNTHSLLFFTILSNVYVTLHFLALVIMTIVDLFKRGIRGYTTTHRFIRGSMNICITLTHLVYHWILVPDCRRRNLRVSPYFEIQSYPDLSAHYYSCLVALIDYFLFTPKNTYTLLEPIKWLGPVFVYAVFVMVRPYVSDTKVTELSRYPYFFVDVDMFGYPKVFAMMFGIFVLLTMLGYVFVAIDRVSFRNGKLTWEKVKKD
ncbi:hypothetical protein TRFO_12721 [Tritrichomonas foetus]|uniref:Integral membrane protein n=1 Tax=Tritrichomonas foetus TaxID=1144522 RepID=A0A1J4L0I5_9EUKA|nr:hypothetical protein TRFO_12721 [Tritrichomonas foetus]|eukprot:OHT17025.1 hypothetical protein TRFO_12721 [Tritrichomonas foetus]